MYPWLVLLLLILNLGVFVWGRQGAHSDPLAQSRTEIRLVSELPAGRQAADVAPEPAAPPVTPASAPAPAAATAPAPTPHTPAAGPGLRL